MKFVKFPTSESMGGKDPLAQVLVNADHVVAAYPQTDGTTILHMLDGDNIEISVQFDIGRKIDSAARDVQAALNAAVADLPGDLPNLTNFREANPNAWAILILALTSDTRPPSAIYDVADTVIAQRISQVAGVAEVNVSGAEQPAIRVRVNPVAIASMGINLEDVRLAIVNANAAGPVGVFEFEQFGEGTRTLAMAIARSKAFSLAGGGDTLAAIEKYGIEDSISYISTGGGAFLEFVEGKKLPAVDILEQRAA